MSSPLSDSQVQPESSDPPRRGLVPLVLGLAALLAAGAGGYAGYRWYRSLQVSPADPVRAIRVLIEQQARFRTLVPEYQDRDGDLVADPPAEPGDPPELRFVGIPDDFADDPGKGRAVWKDFLDHLGKTTGKKVAFADDIKTTDEQLAALRDGRLHVTGFSTGQVPGAVNTAGFVPLVCPAAADGTFAYQMLVVVRADSPVRSPAALRGREVAFSAMSSNSGSRAPMVTLRQEFGLLPGRDYQFTFAGDQVRAVKQLAAGRHDAACVASDLYARVLADPANGLSADQFRTVYESKPFPPVCYGATHRLRPDLAGKVWAAFTSFALPGSSVAGHHRAVKFAPVDYKRDWAAVRETDEAFARLLGPQ